MVKNIAASVRRRLLNESRKNKLNYNDLLERYTRERFLYRLSQSSLSNKFILKGASVFQVWLGNPHRSTRDIDLLAFCSNNPQDVESIFKSIAQQDCNDGIEFTTVKSSVLQAGQKYEGVRLEIEGKIDTAKLFLQVDVGYGHIVTPKAQVREIPTLLDFPFPKMLVYPQETVVAEKFQAMVERGLDNSRVKDYFDLYYLRENFDFKGEQLRQAIKATFSQRRTSLLFEPYPIGLTEKYLEANSNRERQWQKINQQTAIANPITLMAAIPKIAEFVMPVARATKGQELFIHDWKSGLGWQPELKIDFDLLARQREKQFPLPENSKSVKAIEDQEIQH